MDALAESLVNLYFRDSDVFEQVADFYDIVAELSGSNSEVRESYLERTAGEILDEDVDYDDMVETLINAGYASKVSDAHSSVYLQVPESSSEEASLNHARAEIHERLSIGSSDSYQEGLDAYR